MYKSCYLVLGEISLQKSYFTQQSEDIKYFNGQKEKVQEKKKSLEVKRTIEITVWY